MKATDPANVMRMTHRRRGPSFPFLLLLLLPVLCPGQARANEAERLLKTAEDLYTTASFQESLRVLGEAALATSDPGLLGKIHLYVGCNHFELGRPQKARRAFVTALTHDPALKIDTRGFKASIVKMFYETRGTLRGNLSVSADQPGAAVFIDGKKVGTVPYRAEVPIGWHRVALRSTDGKLERWTIVLVKVGLATSVSGPLKPMKGAPGEKANPDDTGAGALRPSSGLKLPSGRDQPPDTAGPVPLYRRWWFWTIVGTVVVGATAGIVAATTGGDDRIPAGADGRYNPGTF